MKLVFKFLHWKTQFIFPQFMNMNSTFQFVQEIMHSDGKCVRIFFCSNKDERDFSTLHFSGYWKEELGIILFIQMWKRIYPLRSRNIPFWTKARFFFFVFFVFSKQKIEFQVNASPWPIFMQSVKFDYFCLYASIWLLYFDLYDTMKKNAP